MNTLKRPLLSNISYYFKEIRENRPQQYLILIIHTIVSVLVLVITSLLPSLLVSFLSQGKTFNEISAPFLILSLILGILSAVKMYVGQASFWGAIAIRIIYFTMQVINKYLNMSFEKIEDENVLKLYKRASENGVDSNSSGAEAMYIQTERFLINASILIVFGLLLTRFNPLAFILSLALGMLNSVLLIFKRRYREKTKPEWSKLSSQRVQLKRDAIKPENGKDARIYDVAKIYSTKVDDLTQQRLVYDRREAYISLLSRVFGNIGILVRDGFVYIFLINAVYQGAMSIAEFTLFFTVMGMFNTWIDEMVDAFHLISIASQDIDDIRNYLEIEDDIEGQSIPQAQDYTLIFDRVSYRYPYATEDALHDLSFTLESHKAIALVGVNGAGKSTIVKLLLGLIKPSSGTITLNGLDIQSFSKEDYYQLFAPAFQENDLWALTLAQNITMSRDGYDGEILHEILKKVGLDDFVNQLPLGLDTNMTTNIHLDGTELSGGQTQKLMLARALYKDAPILVLDEPTASLDAIAEQEMYEQYNQYSKTKASVFISHRLSSTRFCDEILFLEQGRIIEQGTHQELMNKQGAYAEMFKIQSQYYQEEEKSYV